ncbi:MAG TPA: MarR family winged helix-turn-helix transcriptional regulator [Longimicrobiales bacterium]|nr:MarR family winged helix-turn-helix transcriptional regulator [Longimicrobiales bacterium]
MLEKAVDRIMRAYPRIYLACHRRHVFDEAQKRLVSAHQASILDHLDSVDAVSVSALAEHMGVTNSTMSLALDRLEANGYIARDRDDADRRRVHVRLTKAGLRVRQANSVLDPDLVETLLKQLSASERAQAIKGLTLLANAAQLMSKGARV